MQWKLNDFNKSNFELVCVDIDIITSEMFAVLKSPIVGKYWRRSEPYSLYDSIYVLKIKGRDSSFDNYNKLNKTDKANYLKDNWRELVKLAVVGMYKDDIYIMHTKYELTDIKLRELDVIKDDIRKCYTTLESIRVIDGYAVIDKDKEFVSEDVLEIIELKEN